MTISERIARNAKALCKIKGIPISTLENEIGVSAGYLARVRGKRLIPVDTGVAIAAALKIDFNELIKNDAEKTARIAKLNEQIAELQSELDSIDPET